MAVENVYDDSFTITFKEGQRFKEKLQLGALNVLAQAGTFNSIVCTGVGGYILSSKWYFKSFDDTGPEAFTANFLIPENYEEGTDVVVHIGWISAETSGTKQVRWQCGVQRKAVGDNMQTAGELTWVTPQNITPPTTWGVRAEATFTITGTNYKKGDAISVIIFRDAGNAADTAVGDSFVNSIDVELTCNKIGGSM